MDTPRFVWKSWCVIGLSFVQTYIHMSKIRFLLLNILLIPVFTQLILTLDLVIRLFSRLVLGCSVCEVVLYSCVFNRLALLVRCTTLETFIMHMENSWAVSVQTTSLASFLPKYWICCRRLLATTSKCQLFVCFMFRLSAQKCKFAVLWVKLAFSQWNSATKFLCVKTFG